MNTNETPKPPQFGGSELNDGLGWVVLFGQDKVDGPFKIKERIEKRTTFFDRESTDTHRVFLTESDAIKYCIEQAERKIKRIQTKIEKLKDKLPKLRVIHEDKMIDLLGDWIAIKEKRRLE